jgi:hypothetical protein
MSGTSPDLCDNAVAILPRGRRREVLSNVLLWLLDNQWVSSKMHTGRGSKMCRGSGMGLVHSSAVCDAALFFLAETVLGNEGGSATSLLQYMLIIVFKDDIWILAGDRSLARRFISRFRVLASRVFESELVECSAKCVEMIGVIITIEGNNIHTEPRPQDKVPPLSQQSAHPLKVHLRWPAAYMRAELEFVFNRSKKGTCEKVSLSKDFNKAMLQKQCWMH